MKKILKSVSNFYNTWYGVINLVLGFVLLSYIKNTFLMISVICLMLFDIYTWYKNVFKNFGTKSELFATIQQNNAMCVFGGIGSGKSTLGQFILNKFIPKDKQYYNTKNKGFKAFTNKHLLLEDKLELDCGVLVDEAGAQADSFHYDKSDAPTRKRIETLFKFFRQWYGSKSLIILIDQAQGNMNTSLYKNIYYVIQCKGVEQKPSSILLYALSSLFLFFINKKRLYNQKINNPFVNVAISFMEFNKLGDYADHYQVNIEEKDIKKLVVPVYKIFGTLDTYVFREFNPAKDNKPYIWGTDSLKDHELMQNNFDLKYLEQDIKQTFLK